MTPDPSQQKAREEASLLGRLISLDALILVMGCISLGYGILNGKIENIFWGVVIIPGFFILQKVRKKDWKRHWQVMEEKQRMLREQAEQKDAGEK